MQLCRVRLHFFASVLLALACAIPLRAGPEFPGLRADCYDTAADGEEQVTAALARAKADGRTVLVNLGTNGNPECRKLHRAFAAQARLSSRIYRHFVLVYVDVGVKRDGPRNPALLARLGGDAAPALPLLVSLDAAGAVLARADAAGLFERGEVAARKAADFLDSARRKD